MEHFVLYCIVMSSAVLGSIALARPEKEQTTPQNNSSTLPPPNPPPLDSFANWRKVTRKYTSKAKTDSLETISMPGQLELFGAQPEG